jgi:hypothetical protein
VVTGVSGSSGSANLLSGANNVTALQFSLNNPTSSAVTLHTITLTNTASGNASANITSVEVVSGGTVLGSPVLFSGNQATINLNNFVLNGTQNFQVVVNFGGTASGTFNITVQNPGDLTGISGNNGQAAVFTGMPLAGEQITVQQPTLSPTFTATATESSTPTPTTSPTPVPQKVPVIYPNPVDGTQPVNVRPPYYTGVSDVKVEVFTLAFRLVETHTYKSLVAGQDCPIKLFDKYNNELANGLYYVVVTTNAGRSIGKMLVLR